MASWPDHRQSLDGARGIPYRGDNRSDNTQYLSNPRSPIRAHHHEPQPMPRSDYLPPSQQQPSLPPQQYPDASVRARTPADSSIHPQNDNMVAMPHNQPSRENSDPAKENMPRQKTRPRGKGGSGTLRICKKCNEPLTGQFVRALGGTFHLDCYKCRVSCPLGFTADGYR
jgi:hypothetical protein